MKRRANQAFPTGAPNKACPYGAGVGMTPTFAMRQDGGAPPPQAVAMGMMTANMLGLPGIPPMPPTLAAAAEKTRAAGVETAGTSLLGQITACTTGRKVVELMAPRVEAVGAGVLIEALAEVIKKTGSLKARQNVLVELPAGQRMVERVKTALKASPSVIGEAAAGFTGGLSVTQAAKGAYALAKCEVHDEASLKGAVRSCQRTRVRNWPVRAMAHLIAGLARGGIVHDHLDIVQVSVSELLSGRLRELDPDSVSELMLGISTARKHRDGTTETVRRMPDDEKLFQAVADSSCKMMNSFEARQIAELVHVYAEFGFRQNRLFEIAAPKILAAAQKMSQPEMNKCIKAYSRFGIPLREQRARLLNVHVMTGDFARPSDAPPKAVLNAANKEHAIPFSKAITDAVGPIDVRSYD